MGQVRVDSKQYNLDTLKERWHDMTEKGYYHDVAESTGTVYWYALEQKTGPPRCTPQ
jgi:hypothetical protein